MKRISVALLFLALVVGCSSGPPAGPTYHSPRVMLQRIQQSDPGLLTQCDFVGYNVNGALSESCFGPNGDTIYLDTFAKQSIGEQECQDATAVFCHLGNGWLVGAASRTTLHEVVTYLLRRR